MAAYVQDSNFLTRRGVVFLAIIALHVFIAWALATGLARRAIELVAPPIQTEVVEEVQKKDEPPPPPPPQMERPPVEIPPPDVAIEVPVETQTTAIQDVTDKPVVRALPPPPPPPVAEEPGCPQAGQEFPDGGGILSAGVEAYGGRGLGKRTRVRQSERQAHGGSDIGPDVGKCAIG